MPKGPVAKYLFWIRTTRTSLKQIAFLTSLKSKSSVVDNMYLYININICSLLKAAVKIHAKKDSFDASRIVTSSLPVVQQTNGYDCGLFLLHNVETFIKSPFSSTEQFRDAQLWKKSFKPNVKRKKLFDKISATLEESSERIDNSSFR